jgi:hypothetical protein
MSANPVLTSAFLLPGGGTLVLPPEQIEKLKQGHQLVVKMAAGNPIVVWNAPISYGMGGSFGNISVVAPRSKRDERAPAMSTAGRGNGGRGGGGFPTPPTASRKSDSHFLDPQVAASMGRIKLRIQEFSKQGLDIVTDVTDPLSTLSDLQEWANREFSPDTSSKIASREANWKKYLVKCGGYGALVQYELDVRNQNSGIRNTDNADEHVQPYNDSTHSCNTPKVRAKDDGKEEEKEEIPSEKETEFSSISKEA